MKRRGLTPEGQTLEGLVSGAEKSQEEFKKVEAEKVVVSLVVPGVACTGMLRDALYCSKAPSETAGGP